MTRATVKTYHGQMPGKMTRRLSWPRFSSCPASMCFFLSRRNQDVDDRDKPGHDDAETSTLAERRAHADSTKLSTTFFSPALSKAMVSLLPSTLMTWP